MHRIATVPRRPRICLPNVPLHIIQRGNNRQACFFADEDYRFYLDKLARASSHAGCQIHAYALMTNHVHLLVTSNQSQGVGDMMKMLGQRYVQYVNRAYRRSGTLWEGRFRSCPIQEDTYLLSCMRYIELNPVRAGMVAHPGDYPWSSYRGNAQGEANELLTPHPLYLSLGHTDDARHTAYRELFRHELDPGMVDRIRSATNGNFALGNNRFSDEISRALGRRATPGQAGRPRKASKPETAGLFE